MYSIEKNIQIERDTIANIYQRDFIKINGAITIISDKQLNTREIHCFCFSFSSARDFEGSPGGLVLGVILILLL